MRWNHIVLKISRISVSGLLLCISFHLLRFAVDQAFAQIAETGLLYGNRLLDRARDPGEIVWVTWGTWCCMLQPRELGTATTRVSPQRCLGLFFWGQSSSSGKCYEISLKQPTESLRLPCLPAFFQVKPLLFACLLDKALLGLRAANPIWCEQSQSISIASLCFWVNFFCCSSGLRSNIRLFPMQELRGYPLIRRVGAISLCKFMTVRNRQWTIKNASGFEGKHIIGNHCSLRATNWR